MDQDFQEQKPIFTHKHDIADRRICGARHNHKFAFDPGHALPETDGIFERNGLVTKSFSKLINLLNGKIFDFMGRRNKFAFDLPQKLHGVTATLFNEYLAFLFDILLPENTHDQQRKNIRTGDDGDDNVSDTDTRMRLFM